MKKNISLLFVAICVVALAVLYLVDTNNTKQNPTEEDSYSLLFQSLDDDESTIVIGDDVILDVINSNQRKTITLHEDDGKERIEASIPVADGSLESVILVYEEDDQEQELELLDVLIQADGSKYGIVDDFEILSKFIFYNPALIFKSNTDSVVGFDDFIFSDYIVNSDGEYITHIYRNEDEDAIEIVFPVLDSYGDLIDLDSVTFVYKYVVTNACTQADSTKHDTICSVELSNACADSVRCDTIRSIELTDVRIHADTLEYQIIRGIDILKHSVSFVTYPILDGCLERIYPEENIALKEY